MTLTPDIITTTTNPQTFWPAQKKVIRTSDNTVHAIFSEDAAFNHWISRNDGVSWASITIESYAPSKSRYCSVVKDNNDNLYLATDKSENPSGIWFRKGTVNKGVSPWTWSWGAEVEVTGALTHCFYPDILIDGNGYIHIPFARIYASVRCTWARSINGGTTWVIGTDTGGNAYLFPNYYNYYPTIVKDSLNNLYFFVVSSGGNPDYIQVKKATYSAGPSWSLPSGQGNYVSNTTVQGGEVTARCLPDDRFIVAFVDSNSFSGNLYFTKSINPNDVSAWRFQIQLSTDVSIYSPSIIVYSSSKYKIYYIKTDGVVYSRETLDGGNTWSSVHCEYNASPINIALDIGDSPATSVDIIWRSNPANPRTVYHAITQDDYTVFNATFVAVDVENTINQQPVQGQDVMYERPLLYRSRMMAFPIFGGSHVIQVKGEEE